MNTIAKKQSFLQCKWTTSAQCIYKFLYESCMNIFWQFAWGNQCIWFWEGEREEGFLVAAFLVCNLYLSSSSCAHHRWLLWLPIVMKISKPSHKIWARLFLLFFFLARQINFTHFESVCERERGGNGGAASEVDMEMEGVKQKIWKFMCFPYYEIIKHHSMTSLYLFIYTRTFFVFCNIKFLMPLNLIQWR